MMNKQMIEVLSEIRSGYSCFDESERRFYEALSLAIEALRCSEKPNNSDLINRQAAIDEIEERKNANGYHNVAVINELNRLEGYIMRLSSTQYEIIRCKECIHWDTSWQNDYAPNYHYCPLVDGTRRDDFYCADAERIGKQNG